MQIVEQDRGPHNVEQGSRRNLLERVRDFPLEVHNWWMNKSPQERQTIKTVAVLTLAVVFALANVSLAVAAHLSGPAHIPAPNCPDGSYGVPAPGGHQIICPEPVPTPTP